MLLVLHLTGTCSAVCKVHVFLELLVYAKGWAMVHFYTGFLWGFYIAQYPVRRTAQITLHFTDLLLFNPTPT